VVLILGSMCLIAPDSRSQTSRNGPGSPTLHVLMIFNEGKDVPGNIILEQAVRTEMLKLVTNRIEFSPEYLDVSHVSDTLPV